MENNKAERMKEICKIVEEKGFKAKTFSTGWTLDFYLDKGKDILITETVEYLLLCEIQKWLRDVYNIDVWAVPFMNENTYSFIIFKDKLDVTEEIPEFNTFGEALMAGIKEAIKTI